MPNFHEIGVNEGVLLSWLKNYERECGQRINRKRVRERTNLPGRDLLFSDLLYLELRQERTL